METLNSGSSVIGLPTPEFGSHPVVQNYVLVAEDHDDTRFLLRTMLERQPGIKVVEAPNGEIAAALATSLRIDLVLVDRDLALLDGYSLTKRIREHGSIRNLPIVMMSECGESSAQARAYEVGCNDYVVKPFSLSLLSALLQRHLAASAASKSNSDGSAECRTNISVASERRLPGLVELDSEGTVLFLKWNGEERLLEPQNDLVGHNFFSEVVSFKNVAELRECFDTFDRSNSPSNTFLFNCNYEDGSERVSILLARLRENKFPSHPESVLMYIKKAA